MVATTRSLLLVASSSALTSAWVLPTPLTSTTLQSSSSLPRIRTNYFSSSSSSSSSIRQRTRSSPITTTRRFVGVPASSGGESPSSSSVLAEPAHSSPTAALLEDSSSNHQKELQQQQQQHQQQQENQELSTPQKVLNGLFLAASFGYALYAILTIDAGMTRGWSASEIALRIPLDNWGNYEEALANSPIFTKTTINVIIYLLGDWLSQTVFQGNEVLDFDIKRTLRNGFIGLCFGPLVHEYYQFSDAILPPEDGLLLTRIQKIFMDQTIYLTVKCSMYITAVGMLNGDDWPTAKATVQSKIGGVVVTAWKFWPLVHCITYGLIPARHRILWVNSVDLIWNAILASQAQKDAPPTTEEEAAAVVLEAVEDDAMESSVTKTQSGVLPPVVVLDNQWVEEQRESVAEIILTGSEDHLLNSNMTAETA